MKNPNGGIAVNILAMTLVISVGVLIYAMVHTKNTETDTNVPHTEYIPKTITTARGTFSDGLGRANATTQYPLDEFGAGIASVEIFNRDINGDGAADRITRTRHENGSAHFYHEYKIELNDNGRFIDITPDNFRTIEGGDCALQRLQFIFAPKFTVIKISRPWQESWTTPTMAEKTEYNISKNSLRPIRTTQMGQICDVASLF